MLIFFVWFLLVFYFSVVSIPFCSIRTIIYIYFSHPTFNFSLPSCHKHFLTLNILGKQRAFNSCTRENCPFVLTAFTGWSSERCPGIGFQLIFSMCLLLTEMSFMYVKQNFHGCKQRHCINQHSDLNAAVGS